MKNWRIKVVSLFEKRKNCFPQNNTILGKKLNQSTKKVDH
jgi:hypothetical protein